MLTFTELTKMNPDIDPSVFVYLIISAVMYSLKGITATDTKCKHFVLSTDTEIQLESLFDINSFSESECARLCFRNYDCEAYTFDSTTNQCLGFSGRCQSTVTSLTPTTKLFQLKQENTYEITTRSFSFEKSTLYRYFYISSDERTISAHSIPNGAHGNSQGFKKYKGIRGTASFTTSDIVYFEVNINYDIIGNTYNRALVFEIGFSTEDTIDGYYYVGYQNESWSVFGAVTATGSPIELMSRVNGGDVHSIKMLTSIALGSSYQAVYGFFIHGRKGQITVIDKGMAVVLYTFNCVDFNKQLYPVFGMNNKMRFNVTLTLTTGNDIKEIPSMLFK